MTAVLCTVERANGTACAEPVHYATGANRQIAEATQLLLSALNATVDDAARVGTTDTGARRAATALLDACIAVHQAVTAAGPRGPWANRRRAGRRRLYPDRCLIDCVRQVVARRGGPAGGPGSERGGREAHVV